MTHKATKLLISFHFGHLILKFYKMVTKLFEIFFSSRWAIKI